MKCVMFIFVLLVGCSTSNVRPYDKPVKILEDDKPAYEKFELPIKAGLSETILYVVYTYDFAKGNTNKPSTEILFSMDNGRSNSLNAGEYVALSFASVPKFLNIDAGCTGYKQPRKLELGETIKLGGTYILAVSPICFFNRYDGTMNLASGSVRTYDEINGKYFIFKTKQKKIDYK